MCFCGLIVGPKTTKQTHLHDSGEFLQFESHPESIFVEVGDAGFDPAGFAKNQRLLPWYREAFDRRQSEDGDGSWVLGCLGAWGWEGGWFIISRFLVQVSCWDMICHDVCSSRVEVQYII